MFPTSWFFWRFNNASRYLIVGKPQQGKSEQKILEGKFKILLQSYITK